MSKSEQVERAAGAVSTAAETQVAGAAAGVGEPDVEPVGWTSGARDSGASTRDRLLDAAADLFYRSGVHVGVEALCRAAGVSKRSMYQLFDSKDELVTESLRRQAPAFDAYMQPPPDDDRSPRQRILYVFEQMEGLAQQAGFRGCPYVGTAVGLKDPEHPASLLAKQYKNGLTAFFRAEAQRAGVKDPDLLAKQLTIVFDGSSARAVVQVAALDGLAVQTAQMMMDAAGLSG